MNLEVQAKVIYCGQQKGQCNHGIAKDIFMEDQYMQVLHLKDHMNGGHGTQSQHYAGVAFDVGQNLSNSQRAVLRNSASSSGLWTYVEPVSISPTWVHFDKRFR